MTARSSSTHAKAGTLALFYQAVESTKAFQAQSLHGYSHTGEIMKPSTRPMHVGFRWGGTCAHNPSEAIHI
jgi:hypothetical protein